jgi:hypothetical protein
MAYALKDPLLITARLATIVVRAGLVIGMIGLGIGMAVCVFDDAILSRLAQPGVSAGQLNEITGAVLLILLIALITLGLIYDFIARLADIIATVGEGDPFIMANAARLRRMGWQALIIQLVGIPAMLLSTWLEPLLVEDSFGITSDVSLNGFGLALVLFILARVFAAGSAMRADLEGTV